MDFYSIARARQRHSEHKCAPVGIIAVDSSVPLLFESSSSRDPRTYNGPSTLARSVESHRRLFSPGAGSGMVARARAKSPAGQSDQSNHWSWPPLPWNRSQVTINLMMMYVQCTLSSYICDNNYPFSLNRSLDYPFRGSLARQVDCYLHIIYIHHQRRKTRLPKLVPKP
jgi:hypothetical protein